MKARQIDSRKNVVSTNIGEFQEKKDVSKISAFHEKLRAERNKLAQVKTR